MISIESVNTELSVSGAASNSTEDVPVGWIMAAQVWAWTVSSVGGLGNLLTISTIIHQLYLGRVCRRRCTNYIIQRQLSNSYIRHGSVGKARSVNDRHPRTTCGNPGCCRPSPSRPVVVLEGDTLLLLHLSICDFLYCTVNLPLTAITYSNGYSYIIGETNSPPSTTFCTGAALFRYVNALAEWTTLGLLTVQRCVDLGRSRGTRFFKPRPTMFFILAIWVLSVLLQMPTLIKYSYDPTTFKCDMESSSQRIYFYSLESLVPCVLMFTGCLSIIFQICSNTRNLRAAGMPQELVKQRFQSMMKTSALLLALLFLFLICIIPICVYNIAILLPTDEEMQPNVPLGIAIFMVYWIQYAVNFLVYAASNANYRKAYKQFLCSLPVFSRNCVKKKRWKDHPRSQMSIVSSSFTQMCNITSITHLASYHNPEDTNGSHLCSFHSSDTYLSKPRLLTLHRLKSCPLEKNHLPIQTILEGERKFNTLPATGLQFWSSSQANNGTQSFRSSVATLESDIGHKVNAETLNC